MLRQDEKTYISRRAASDDELDMMARMLDDEQTDSIENRMPNRTPWYASIVRWYTRGSLLLEGMWARCLLVAVLAFATLLLYRLPGGFPPWAWRFLARVLPQFSALLSAQGFSALFALGGLLLLSFSLFVLWVITLYCWVMLPLSFWSTYRRWQQRRHAELLADDSMTHLYEQEVQQQEQEAMEQEQQWERVAMEQTAHLRAQASGVIRAVQPRKVQHNRPLDNVDDANGTNINVTQDTADDTGEDEDDIEYIYTTTPIMPTVYGRGDASRRPDSPPQRSQEDNTGDITEDDMDDVAENATEEMSEDITQNETQPLRLEASDQITNYAVSSGSHPGKVRKNAPNEDSLLAIQGMCETPTGPQPVGLFVVADGMGGHADGQEASRVAVQVMGDVLLPLLLNKAQEPEVFLESLKETVHRANLAIYQRNREREHMMGTTLTAALVVGSTAHVVNAGDSRTYVYRAGGELTPITRDHSSVARLVEAGAIEPDDIYIHPLRNQIYRCLGDSASVQVDTFEVSLALGDTLLLCSDGLWEMVRDPHIAAILKQTHRHPTTARDALIQAALDGGGADNVSVIVATMV